MLRTSALLLLALSPACRVEDNGDTNTPNPDGSPTALDVVVELPEDTQTNIRLEANEPDGDDLTFAIDAGPQNGTALLDGRRVEYTPNADFSGEDSFTFTATDVDGTSAPATVSITVTPVNDAPRASVTDAVRLVGQSLTLRADATDPEGDAVTVSWSQTSGPSVTLGDQTEPTLTVRAAGTYQFTATLDDGTDTADATLTVRALDVSLGTDHVVAVDADGNAWSWGNQEDELLARRDAVVGVVGPVCTVLGEFGCAATLGDVAAISASEEFTLALDNDGTIWGWGYEDNPVLSGLSETPVDLQGPDDVIAIAAGTQHALALDANGAVWAWGSDDDGGLGNPSVSGAVSASSAVAVCIAYDAVDGCTQTLTGAIAIAAGSFDSNTSMALTEDGTVWAWGENSDGVLGDDCDLQLGTCVDSEIARPVCAGDDPASDNCLSLTGATSLSVGGEHAIVATSDGAALTWGNGGSGQLGDACDDTRFPCEPRSVAQAVCDVGDAFDTCTPLADVAQVSAGHDHILMLLTDGSVVAAGSNGEGELGDGCGGELNCREDRATVLPVCAADSGLPCDGLTGIAGVRAGDEVSAALTLDGDLLVWGNNSPGLIGNVPEGGPFAVPVGSDTDWVDISSGDDQSVAIKADGTLWSLANNDSYAIGNCDLGTDPDDLLDCTNPYAPVRLTEGPNGSVLPTTWDRPAAGVSHAGAVSADGAVYVWGRATSGALGLADYELPIGRPVQVVGLTGVRELSLGDDFSLALMDDGTIKAWGLGNDGQLGDGLQDTTEIPVDLLSADNDSPDTDWIAVQAGDDFGVAQKSDGTLWTWGANDDGQLSLGTTDDVSTATQILGVEGSASPTDWDMFSAGRNHVAAIRGGQMYVWGELDEGRRGNGCLEDDTCEIWEETSTPVPVLGPDGLTILDDWTAVFAGDDHTLGIRADGSVWAFGEDDSGSMGVGFSGDVSLPTPVCRAPIAVNESCAVPLTDAVHVSASDETGFAILSDGSLWAWGDNDEGRHGYGRPEQSIPTFALWSAWTE